MVSCGKLDIGYWVCCFVCPQVQSDAELAALVACVMQEQVRRRVELEMQQAMEAVAARQVTSTK